MSALRYLNIGNYSGNSFDADPIIKHTLRRLFQHITINLSLYDDQYIHTFYLSCKIPDIFNNKRVYFICVAKFLTFSDDG